MALAEALLQTGHDLTVFDPDLDPERPAGLNFALAADQREVLRARPTRALTAAVAGVGLVLIGQPMAAHLAALPADLPRFDITKPEGFDA